MKYVVILTVLLCPMVLMAQGDSAKPKERISKLLVSNSSAKTSASSTSALEKIKRRRMRRLPYRNGMPRPPKGMSECTEVLLPSESYVVPKGETIRYTVEIDGLSVGTIDFQVHNRGTYGGAEVDEYRSLFKIDGLVSTFMPVQGQAASVVNRVDLQPIKAMNRYSIDTIELDETIEFQTHAKELKSTRERNGKSAKQSRSFDYGVQDFVTAFYQLRRMPRDIDGCLVIYSNLRAYTVRIKNLGKEYIKTPIGFKEADHYSIEYGSEYSKVPKKGFFWVGIEDNRLPYRLVVDSRHKVEANVHFYKSGEQY